MSGHKGKGPMRVGEALEAYLTRTGLDERLDEAAAVPEWAGCVGERIAAVTEPITVSGGVLIVAVRSSAWLMELKLMERRILKRINAGRMRGEIERIRFVMSGDDGAAGCPGARGSRGTE